MRVLVNEMLHGFFFYRGHLFLVVFSALLQDMLDLRDSDYREELAEKEEEAGKEQVRTYPYRSQLPRWWAYSKGSSSMAGNHDTEK
jgi:hypothetical protein